MWSQRSLLVVVTPFDRLSVLVIAISSEDFSSITDRVEAKRNVITLDEIL